MPITWTKEWMASDDGTIVSGLDLKNIQDDITSGSTGDAASIWGVPVIQPTAAENGKVLFYDHATPSFDYLTASSVVIPTGVILLWSGAVSAIPTGWVICDGNNGTPNLTDRFILHADADSGGTNDVGDTGGASTHSHTITVNSADIVVARGAGNVPVDDNSGGSDVDIIDPHVHTGSSSSVSNVPRYYALAYIMKT